MIPPPNMMLSQINFTSITELDTGELKQNMIHQSDIQVIIWKYLQISGTGTVI